MSTTDQEDSQAPGKDVSLDERARTSFLRRLLTCLALFVIALTGVALLIETNSGSQGVSLHWIQDDGRQLPDVNLSVKANAEEISLVDRLLGMQWPSPQRPSPVGTLLLSNAGPAQMRYSAHSNGAMIYQWIKGYYIEGGMTYQNAIMTSRVDLPPRTGVSFRVYPLTSPTRATKIGVGYSRPLTSWQRVKNAVRCLFGGKAESPYAEVWINMPRTEK